MWENGYYEKTVPFPGLSRLIPVRRKALSKLIEESRPRPSALPLPRYISTGTPSSPSSLCRARRLCPLFFVTKFPCARGPEAKSRPGCSAAPPTKKVPLRQRFFRFVGCSNKVAKKNKTKRKHKRRPFTKPPHFGSPQSALPSHCGMAYGAWRERTHSSRRGSHQAWSHGDVARDRCWSPWRVNETS